MSFQDYSESVAAKVHLGTVNKPLFAGIGCAALILAAVAVWLVACPAQDAEAQSKEETTLVSVIEESGAKEEIPSDVFVHVGGCVNNPGVVKVASDARVGDAIEAAGGLAADASADSVNMARAVVDGEQVIVPSIKEAKEAKVATASEAPSSATTTQAEGAKPEASGKVNINTATAAELQTLNGIGESKANKIVAYRQANGPFSTIDDLTNVSGIGEKTLESLRNDICV